MNRLLLLALLVMLAACRTAPPTHTAMPQVDSTLKLVTLNLYHDKDEWPKRRTQIVNTLAALQPDVIALQEVLQHDTLPNQAQWLAQELGYQVAFYTLGGFAVASLALWIGFAGTLRPACAGGTEPKEAQA